MRYSCALALAAAMLCLGVVDAGAQGSYPLMDRIAQRVIQKYQSASCQQLAAQRAQRGAETPNPMEQRAVQLLHQDPQLRQAFLNKVAAPIANKLFECGMIP
jgi:hypothetical protein